MCVGSWPDLFQVLNPSSQKTADTRQVCPKTGLSQCPSKTGMSECPSKICLSQDRSVLCPSKLGLSHCPCKTGLSQCPSKMTRVEVSTSARGHQNEGKCPAGKKNSTCPAAMESVCKQESLYCQLSVRDVPTQGQVQRHSHSGPGSEQIQATCAPP